MNKKVGIIGSGMVAQALGNGLLKYDYEVMLGTRDASKLDQWQSAAGSSSKVGTFEETAAFGELVILAVKGRYAKAVLETVGTANIAGKTVIDTSNPIADQPPVNGVLSFFTEQNESLMEELQIAFPEVNFVKAFSCVGSDLMVNPPFKEKPTMFTCGNNEAAKAEVNIILELFGWAIMDMGGVEAARAIEPLCKLWCIPGFKNNQWRHAFRLDQLQ